MKRVPKFLAGVFFVLCGVAAIAQHGVFDLIFGVMILAGGAALTQRALNGASYDPRARG